MERKKAGDVRGLLFGFEEAVWREWREGAWDCF